MGPNYSLQTLPVQSSQIWRDSPSSDLTTTSWDKWQFSLGNLLMSPGLCHCLAQHATWRHCFPLEVVYSTLSGGAAWGQCSLAPCSVSEPSGPVLVSSGSKHPRRDVYQNFFFGSKNHFPALKEKEEKKEKGKEKQTHTTVFLESLKQRLNWLVGYIEEESRISLMNIGITSESWLSLPCFSLPSCQTSH